MTSFLRFVLFIGLPLSELLSQTNSLQSGNYIESKLVAKVTSSNRRPSVPMTPVNNDVGQGVNMRSKRDVGESSYFYYQQPHYPKDCKEVYEQCNGEMTESGIFTIQPDRSPEAFEVYCNNSKDGRRWTIFQRRMDGDVDFYRNWMVYKKGFGFLQREFWLGNDKLAYLTNQGDYELRIDLANKIGDAYHAKFDLFRISDEWTKYRLVDLGQFLPESTAGVNALSHHRNMSFSTYDSDHDTYSYNCAVNFHGAWWYHHCHNSNLNGDYFGCTDCDQSIRWNNLPGGQHNIKYTEMKIRPL